MHNLSYIDIQYKRIRQLRYEFYINHLTGGGTDRNEEYYLYDILSGID